MPEEQIRIGVEYTDADKAKRDLEEISDGTSKVGESVEQTGDQSERTNKFLDDGATLAKGFIAGFAGLEGIKALTQALADNLERANAALQEAARRSVGEQGAVIRFAGVRGLAGEEGLAQTADEARELQKAGNFSSLQDAALFGEDVTAIARQSGQGGRALEIANFVAPIAASRGLTSGEASGLAGFLIRTGRAGSEDDALRTIQQIDSALGGRVQPAELQGLERAIGKALETGGTFEEGLGSFAQARRTPAGLRERAAGSLVEQIADVTAAPNEAQQAALGQDISGLPYGQRLGAFGDLVRGIETPEQRAAFLRAFPSVGRFAFQFYGPEATAAGANAVAAAQAATAAQQRGFIAQQNETRLLRRDPPAIDLDQKLADLGADEAAYLFEQFFGEGGLAEDMEKIRRLEPQGFFEKATGIVASQPQLVREVLYRALKNEGLSPTQFISGGPSLTGDPLSRGPDLFGTRGAFQQSVILRDIEGALTGLQGAGHSRQEAGQIIIESINYHSGTSYHFLGADNTRAPALPGEASRVSE